MPYLLRSMGETALVPEVATALSEFEASPSRATFAFAASFAATALPLALGSVSSIVREAAIITTGADTLGKVIAEPRGACALAATALALASVSGRVVVRKAAIVTTGADALGEIVAEASGASALAATALALGGGGGVVEEAAVIATGASALGEIVAEASRACPLAAALAAALALPLAVTFALAATLAALLVGDHLPSDTAGVRIVDSSCVAQQRPSNNGHLKAVLLGVVVLLLEILMFGAAFWPWAVLLLMACTWQACERCAVKRDITGSPPRPQFAQGFAAADMFTSAS